MNRLMNLQNKDERYCVGLMSGTSVDGIDAALVQIQGSFLQTRTKLLAFENYPYDPQMRSRIFDLFCDKTSDVSSICHMNFLLGELFAAAALHVCRSAGFPVGELDLVGSHGQTIYHRPDPVTDCGFRVSSTLQIGEGAVIARRTGAVTVCDFRVMDMAAGGQGAPLVPYTEYLLYAQKSKTVALLNIGGIANITVLPAGCAQEDIQAFDTGPGNMVIDGVLSHITKGRCRFDRGGETAAAGQVCQRVLAPLLEDPYFTKEPPKSTGREMFGLPYTERFIERCVSEGLRGEDMAATATALTAQSVAAACRSFVRAKIDRLVVGGGGSYNNTLLAMLRAALPDTEVCTQEDLGLNSDAKEAIAFAVLANEAIFGNPGNLPSATGATGKAVLGKIIL